MGVGIMGNTLWVVCGFVSVKLEYRVLTTTLLPFGLIPPGYLLYKAYDLYTVRSRGIAQVRARCGEHKCPPSTNAHARCERRMASSTPASTTYALPRTVRSCCRVAVARPMLASMRAQDVWVEPIMATLALGIMTRLVLLVLMLQATQPIWPPFSRLPDGTLKPTLLLCQMVHLPASVAARPHAADAS